MNKKIDYSHPLYLEEVACDFLKLTIVANHAGWLWVNEMVTIAWKHTNICLEMGGVLAMLLTTFIPGIAMFAVECFR